MSAPLRDRVAALEAEVAELRSRVEALNLPEPLRLAGRLSLRPRECAGALGLSERAFRALLPRLPHVRAGGAVLIPVDALRRWLEEQARAERAALGAIEEEFAARIRVSRGLKK